MTFKIQEAMKQMRQNWDLNGSRNDIRKALKTVDKTELGNFAFGLLPEDKLAEVREVTEAYWEDKMPGANFEVSDAMVEKFYTEHSNRMKLTADVVYFASNPELETFIETAGTAPAATGEDLPEEEETEEDEE